MKWSEGASDDVRKALLSYQLAYSDAPLRGLYQRCSADGKACEAVLRFPGRWIKVLLDGKADRRGDQAELEWLAEAALMWMRCHLPLLRTWHLCGRQERDEPDGRDECRYL